MEKVLATPSRTFAPQPLLTFSKRSSQLARKFASFNRPCGLASALCFASLSWRRRRTITAGSDGTLWPWKTTLCLSIVLRRTLSRRCVSLAKTDQSWVTKRNLLYIQTQTSALERHFSAPKRTNVPASAFHKPLDLPWMSAILYPPKTPPPPTFPSPPVPHPRWRHGRCGRIKSPDAKVPAMYPATETPKRQRKTLEPIDGVRKQISDSTVGQRLKVADRNHSASTSPASQMLMSLLGKVSPLGIFKVSAVDCMRRQPKAAHLELPSCPAQLVDIVIIKYCNFSLLHLQGASQIWREIKMN